MRRDGSKCWWLLISSIQKQLNHLTHSIDFPAQIPYGNKYDKDFILRTLLQAISPEVFIPHYWKSETTCVLFYVDDFKMAKCLASADRTIDLPNGFKMIIKVRNGVPPVQMDAKLKELMATAMDKRYNPATKALDLSRFHADDILREVFCPLFRPPIMLAAIDIIAEKVPDLVALSLDNNKIQSLDYLKCLATKLPNLQILHLADNKVSIQHRIARINCGERKLLKCIRFPRFFFAFRSARPVHWRPSSRQTSSTLCWKEIRFAIVTARTPYTSGIAIIMHSRSLRALVFIIISFHPLAESSVSFSVWENMHYAQRMRCCHSQAVTVSQSEFVSRSKSVALETKIYLILLGWKRAFHYRIMFCFKMELMDGNVDLNENMKWKRQKLNEKTKKLKKRK